MRVARVNVRVVRVKTVRAEIEEARRLLTFGC